MNRNTFRTRLLALPLLARVVAEHHGRLSWTASPAVEACLRWPLAVHQGTPPAAHRPAALAPSLGSLAGRP